MRFFKKLIHKFLALFNLKISKINYGFKSFPIVEANNDEINFLVSAKSFLHSQVRIMVGTLVDIGLNKIEKSISEIIQSKKREYAGVTAPPEGLYLLKIDY